MDFVLIRHHLNRRVGSHHLLAFKKLCLSYSHVRYLQRRARSLYDVLGVSPTSTQKEIKAKYLELAKKYHPDAVVSKTEAERELVTKKFQEIQSAYQVLSKDIDRKDYDA